MRKILSFLLALICIFTLTSCNGTDAGQNGGEVQNDNPAPEASVPGYYTEEQMYSGGSEAEGVNVKSITTEQDGEDYLIHISFIYGSKYSEVDEAKMDCVPQYRAFVLTSPSRLVLELGNIEYWDWENTMDEGLSSNLLEGTFAKIPYESSRYTIFFQLKENIIYKVEENDDVLTIRLRQNSVEPETKYVVALDAYYEYQENIIPSDWGFMPTLCSDLYTRILVSNPWDSQEEAQEFLERASADMSDIDPELFSVIEITGNELPAVGEGVTTAHKPIVKVNGVEKTLEQVLANGAYVTSSSDGKTMIFSSLINGGERMYTELWKVEQNGKIEKLDYDFYSVQQIEFSPDGNEIIIVDNTSSGYALYCLNLESGLITNLSEEEGVGDAITNCVWGESSDILYLLSGTQMQQQILKYDRTQESGSRVTQLAENPYFESELAFRDNALYFINTNEAGAVMIYRLNTQTGEKMEISAGVNFKLAAGGKIAVMDYTENAETGNYEGTLKIVDSATKEETIVEQGINVAEYQWASDGNKLYYIKGGSGDENYPYTLCMYDLAAKTVTTVALTSVGEFYTTNTPNQIMLVYATFGENAKTITYKMDVNNL